MSVLLTLSVFAQESNTIEKPDSLSFAHEDHNAFPWVYAQNGLHIGLDIDLLEQVCQQLGVKAEFQAYPWLRALTEMSYGVVDAVFASSYKVERERYGLYPSKGGELDVSKHLHMSGYSLYVNKGSQLSFDGSQFENVTHAIGVQRGFSIARDLKPFKVPLSDRTDDPERILHQLLRGRLAAAALQTARAERIINSEPRLKASIRNLNLQVAPFQQKPYFVMFSKQFIAKYPEFTQLFWQTVEQVRKSTKFTATREALLKDNSLKK